MDFLKTITQKIIGLSYVIGKDLCDDHTQTSRNSNLADLPLDLPADLTPLVLTSSGQNEFKFGTSTPTSVSRSNPLALTSSGQGWQLADLLAHLLPWY